jgi:hypothetical protein
MYDEPRDDATEEPAYTKLNEDESVTKLSPQEIQEFVEQLEQDDE